MSTPADELTDPTPAPGTPSDGSGLEPGPGLSRNLLVVLGLVAIAAVAVIALVTVGGDSNDGVDDSSTAASGATEGGGTEGGGTEHPDVTGLVFADPDGNEATLAEFDGQPLVVNFFAAWCAPCRAELPDLESVHVASGDGVQFVGVSHDIDTTSWLSLIEEVGVTFPTYYQPEQEIFESLDLLGMPSTIFIDADGEVTHTYTGILDDEILRQLIADHLDVAVPEPQGA